MDLGGCFLSLPLVPSHCRKFEGNLTEASASRSCGGGSGGLFIYLFIHLFLNLAEAAASMQFTALPSLSFSFSPSFPLVPSLCLPSVFLFPSLPLLLFFFLSLSFSLFLFEAGSGGWGQVGGWESMGLFEAWTWRRSCRCQGSPGAPPPPQHTHFSFYWLFYTSQPALILRIPIGRGYPGEGYSHNLCHLCLP